MNDVLDKEKDLKNTQKALNNPEAKKLIDQYGENLTIFAPNDEAFKKDKFNFESDPDAQKTFFKNHVILGQRVPIYRNEDPSAGHPELPSGPKIVKSNIYVQGGPLVHIIDRINHEPINSMQLAQLQPSISKVVRMIQESDLGKELEKENTFFCPFDKFIEQRMKQNPDPNLVKRKFTLF